MSVFTKVLGGCAIVLVFFYSTLFLLNTFDPKPEPPPLAREARSIMAAMVKYQGSRGAYPVFPIPDSPLIELKKELAKAGYLASDDPPMDKDARYVSFDGKIYGLLFYVDRTDNNPQGSQCIVEVGRSATGWWGQPPPCRF
jgi:hypothetical protein